MGVKWYTKAPIAFTTIIIIMISFMGGNKGGKIREMEKGGRDRVNHAFHVSLNLRKILEVIVV